MSRRSEKRAAQDANYRSMIPNSKRRLNYYERGQANRIQMYYDLLESLAISRFTWRDLPDGVDARFIELNLFERQLCLFFMDKRLGRFMCTQANYSGNMNLYYNPTSFQPYGVSYHHPRISGKKCVPVWDNLLRKPMYDVLNMYANRLAMLDRALDVNLENINIPLIIAVNETQKNTAVNALRQRQNGEPAIFTYRDTDIQNMITSFPNVTPYLADKILQAKSQIWNEAISFLGIQNSTEEKAERLITDEVQAGQEKVNIFRVGFLQARQQACDQINRMFNLTVSVDWTDTTTGGQIDLEGNDGNE